MGRFLFCEVYVFSEIVQYQIMNALLTKTNMRKPLEAQTQPEYERLQTQRARVCWIVLRAETIRKHLCQLQRRQPIHPKPWLLISDFEGSLNGTHVQDSFWKTGKRAFILCSEASF